MPVATKRRTAKRKYGPPWEDAVVEREWDDGYAVVRVRSATDLTTLSRNGGGCSEHHVYWVDVVTPKSEYFFVMMKPDGGIGPILFCKDYRWALKKHPMDGAEFDKWYAKHGRGYRIESDLYDGRYDSLESFAGAYNYYPDPHADLEQAKADYEFYKKRALRYGPLGKDNPYKYEVDEANRRVQHCKGVVDKHKAVRRVRRGDVFKYGRVTLFIVEIAGRGLDYNGANTRYTDKWAEFIGKEG